MLCVLSYMHLRWVIRQSIRAGYVPESKAERSKRMQSAGFGQDEYASNLTVGDGYTHIRSGPLGSIDSDLESDDEEEYEFGELLSKRSKLLRKIRNHAWANGVLYFEVYCIATGIILHGEHRHDVDVSFLITLLVTIFISILVLTNFTLEHARKRLESGPVRMTMRVPAASKSLSSGGDDAMYQALGDEFESDEVPGNEDPEAAVVDSMKEEDVAGSDSLAHVPGYGKGAGSSSLGDSVMTAPLLDDKVTISTRKRRGSDSSESSVSSSTSSSTASTAYSITAPITSHRQAKMKRRMKDIDDEMEKVERARFGYVFIRMWHFLSEKHEREDPKTYGERVHFRRIFLIVGLVFYGWLTFNELHIVQTTKVKDQVKKLLAKSGVGLTWPDNGHGGTIFDDAFALYGQAREIATILMVVSFCFLCLSLLCDVAWRAKRGLKWSRIFAYMGVLVLYLAVLSPAIPNYLRSTHVNKIVPQCAPKFDNMVQLIAGDMVGIFCSAFFAFELLPLLLALTPSLVRAAALILVEQAGLPQRYIIKGNAEEMDVSEGGYLYATMPKNPSKKRTKWYSFMVNSAIMQEVIYEEDETIREKMNSVRWVFVFASLLTFMVTCLSLSIIYQLFPDPVVGTMIFVFWVVPCALCFGIFIAKSQKALSWTYLLWLWCYCLPLLVIIMYEANKHGETQWVIDQLKTFSPYAEFFAEVGLANVVLADIMYSELLDDEGEGEADI
eukprot:TRINITY_DN450_c0_g1_i6.p1 TRINITY_DN450_c0_g1~~TRINITY_DN450_c0_g1_i6.p1  ORF type:complete len:726 (-),score=216.02 TRINITY_DN450_c0_g1_i6:338-2515(-)